MRTGRAKVSFKGHLRWWRCHQHLKINKMSSQLQTDVKTNFQITRTGNNSNVVRLQQYLVNEKKSYSGFVGFSRKYCGKDVMAALQDGRLRWIVDLDGVRHSPDELFEDHLRWSFNWLICDIKRWFRRQKSCIRNRGHLLRWQLIIDTIYYSIQHNSSWYWWHQICCRSWWHNHRSTGWVNWNFLYLMPDPLYIKSFLRNDRVWNSWNRMENWFEDLSYKWRCCWSCRISWSSSSSWRQSSWLCCMDKYQGLKTDKKQF